jgi:hypothetical protein
VTARPTDTLLDIVTSTVPGVVHVTFENFAVASFSSK